ncbi:MAG TPA: hypothetical protein VF014_08300 [Casimicrobiaceae bacterium]|nr:hypothetical protein [Casimicrobiaceae bacterium]
MKLVLTATALAIFGLVPAMGFACEYNDDSAASAAPPAQLGLASPPAASKVPAPTAAQALAPKAAKPTADKAKPLAPDRKLTVVTSN